MNPETINVGKHGYPEPISSKRDELLTKLETLGAMREL